MIGEAALFEIGIMICSLAVAAWIASILNESDIPIFILMGIGLGPYGLGRFMDFYVGVTSTAEEFIEIGSELGIIFLLFFIGLSFSLKKLRKHRGTIAVVGTMDLLNFAPGVLVGYWFFQDLLAAFLIGGIVYISSSAVISKSLMDLGWESTPESDQMLERLVFEDLVIVVYLSVISTILLGEGADLRTIATNIGLAMLFMSGLIAFMFLKPGFFEKILDTDSNETFVLRAIGIIVIIAGMAIVLGLSEAVAAFFLGIAFGGTDHLSKLQRQLYSERYLFGSIFFFWIGTRTDPLLFKGIGTLLITVIVFSGIYKFFTAYYGAKFFHLSSKGSTRVGLGMITRGEFSLIIAALSAEAVGPYATEPITEIIPAFAVSYVLVMSILGTMMMQHMDKITSWLGLKEQ
ncbi:MAG: cation:proton antiporter [Candidatus Natronoplasma sp.]